MKHDGEIQRAEVEVTRELGAVQFIKFTNLAADALWAATKADKPASAPLPTTAVTPQSVPGPVNAAVQPGIEPVVGSTGPQTLADPPSCFWRLDELFTKTRNSCFSENFRRFVLYTAQQTLREREHYKSNSDGAPGKNTHEAIKSYQGAPLGSRPTDCSTRLHSLRSASGAFPTIQNDRRPHPPVTTVSASALQKRTKPLFASGGRRRYTGSVIYIDSSIASNHA